MLTRRHHHRDDVFHPASCGANARRASAAVRGRARGGGARGRRRRRRRRRRRSRGHPGLLGADLRDAHPALVPHAEPMHEKTSAIAAPPSGIGRGGQRAMLSGAILAACGGRSWRSEERRAASGERRAEICAATAAGRAAGSGRPRGVPQRRARAGFAIRVGESEPPTTPGPQLVGKACGQSAVRGQKERKQRQQTCRVARSRRGSAAAPRHRRRCTPPRRASCGMPQGGPAMTNGPLVHQAQGLRLHHVRQPRRGGCLPPLHHRRGGRRTRGSRWATRWRSSSRSSTASDGEARARALARRRVLRGAGVAPTCARLFARRCARRRLQCLHEGGPQVTNPALDPYYQQQQAAAGQYAGGGPPPPGCLPAGRPRTTPRAARYYIHRRRARRSGTRRSCRAAAATAAAAAGAPPPPARGCRRRPRPGWPPPGGGAARAGPPPQLLLGVGGTNLRFALVPLWELRAKTLRSRHRALPPRLCAAARGARASAEKPAELGQIVACTLSVCGPVSGGKASASPRRWAPTAGCSRRAPSPRRSTCSPAA